MREVYEQLLGVLSVIRLSEMRKERYIGEIERVQSAKRLRYCRWLSRDSQRQLGRCSSSSATRGRSNREMLTGRDGVS